MTICDLTHAYHETSGGIRTYIDAKRRYVLDHTDHTHVTLVPGAEAAVRREGRATWVTLASPFIRGAEPYRWFPRPGPVLDALDEIAPDVVELGTFYMPTEWTAAFAHRWRARRAGRRSALAIQAHTDFADSYAEVYVSKVLGTVAGRIARWGCRLYTKWMFAAADVRLAPSPLQAERMRAQGVRDLTVVAPGVDVDLFAPDRADPALREAIGVPEGAVLAAYVGRLDTEKRVRLMADAAALADRERPTRLVLVGEGPHRAELEAREAAGAPIRVLPYVDDRAGLARLLASADVYVSAGPYETFGLSVIEAQACGLPVVGVEAGALVERVPPTVGFLGPVDDAGALAAHLLQAADARDTLGPAARALAVRQHSWDASFRRLMALYEAALAA